MEAAYLLLDVVMIHLYIYLFWPVFRYSGVDKGFYYFLNNIRWCDVVRYIIVTALYILCL